MFKKKPPWGFRAAIRLPSRRIVERCELGSPSVRRRWERAPALPEREVDRRARVCVRACVSGRARVLGDACAWRYVLGINGIQGKPQLHTG